MGFARDGTVIRDGDNLVVGGVLPVGIAVAGSVIYRAAAAPVEAGWELIEHVGASEGSYMTTPPIDTTDADLLVVVGATYLMSPVPLPSDSKGNSWVPGVSNQGGNSGVGLAYCRGGTVGPGHTFSWTGDYGVICVLAFRGSAVSPADQSSGASIGNAAMLRPGEITPTVANALIITGISHNDQVASIDSGFDVTDLFPAGAQMAGGAAWLVQPAAAAVNPAWAITVSPYSASAVIMSFKGD